LDIRKIASLKDGTDITGSRTRVRVVKNKVAPPFREAEFDIIYGKGISREGEIVDLGAQHGILEKSGTWYSFGEERLGQGRDNSKIYMMENPQIMKSIEGQIRKKLGIDHAPKAPDMAPAEEEAPKPKDKAKK
ncbi:MAG TPA: DNA recombination/repair protein RecA, partial [candidate division Zixibacteria bacterium]|nr:DNA recombination/repair protein RecA [candidate division Zixibacteria bacterium]